MIGKMNNFKTFIFIFFIFSLFSINYLIKWTDNYDIYMDDYQQEEGNLRVFCIIRVDILFLNTHVNSFDCYFFSYFSE
jgi:hypothetical protein